MDEVICVPTCALFTTDRHWDREWMRTEGFQTYRFGVLTGTLINIQELLSVKSWGGPRDIPFFINRIITSSPLGLYFYSFTLTLTLVASLMFCFQFCFLLFLYNKWSPAFFVVDRDTLHFFHVIIALVCIHIYL